MHSVKSLIRRRSSAGFGSGRGTVVHSDESTDLADVWTRAVSHFDESTTRPHHKAWIGLTRPLGLVEDTALLAAPNEFAKDYLENRLRPMIAAALSAELGREIRVAVTVQSPEEQAEAEFGAGLGHEDDDFDEPRFDDWAPAPRPTPPLYSGGRLGRPGPDREARLNPKYSF